MSYNLFSAPDFNRLKEEEPDRFKHCGEGAIFISLKDLDLDNIDGIDTVRFNNLARLMRGFIFTSLEASHSGHPGGSSGKVEQFLAMVLGGVMAFDPLNPKNTGRDRVVWSAGHCSPGLYGGLSLMYEALRRQGRQFDTSVINAVLPEDLLDFRKIDGPQGHIENYTPLSDVATGPSGHGFPSAGGMAIVHRSCGLPFKTWVFMGDAESEEGMTYEARNVLASSGIDNITVSLDYNHFGIDGPIEEVMDSDYISHWSSLGWNVIEVDGHNVLELIYAYQMARTGFGNQKPTVVIAHTLKGKCYGVKENTADSHGSPAGHDDYVQIMKDLGFDIPGVEGEVMGDIEVILSQFSDEDQKYVLERLEKSKGLIKNEEELVEIMKMSLPDRRMINPRHIKRPDTLPEELQFKVGDKVATRKAAKAWFEWLMKETAFFYAGTGDLSKSILTNSAENVYGIINKNNQFGRGIRFGIAEQNMAMMSSALTQDVLPGGYQPVSVFGTYAVFTSMMSDAVRLAVIGNYLKPETAGFFIMLAAHDGPETGEDGPTHQGLYWMSMFEAYPGIKVYKPFDAAETIEMLFYALEKGEPVAFSITRPDNLVLDRSWGSKPSDAINGAYIYKNYTENNKLKKCLVISGMQILLNTLEILEDLEKEYDVKMVNVTSPGLFEDLRKENMEKSNEIYSAQDRKVATILHAGWKGFLQGFLLPDGYANKNINIDTYLKSGNVADVYELAGLDANNLKQKILKSFK